MKLFIIAVLAITIACQSNTANSVGASSMKNAIVNSSIMETGVSSPSDTVKKITKSEADWKKELSPLAYNVLREQGTERAFTGELVNNHEKGTYVCAACGLPLFSSDTKFESGTGWPSFYQAIAKNHVEEKTDESYGMKRTEVACARCNGHLGHVFDDGPRPTGLRYCMNSVSLKFVKAK